ncbi:MAG: hypothetical protein CL609_09950 [Anaerolineaceae bacterium]|nr:hypothetical protein [Anaerolineaceae bacterium]
MTTTNIRLLKRKRQKRNRWITVIIILLVMSGGGYYYTQVYNNTPTSTEEPALQTAKVRTGDIVISLNGIGEILPLDDISVGFQTNGTIKSIPVSVGDIVEEGQLLAQLDDTNAQLQLEQAQLDWLVMTSPQAIAEAELDVFLSYDQVTVAEENLKYLISPSVYHWEIEVDILEKNLLELNADPQTTEETLQLVQNELKTAKSNLDQAKYVYQTVYLIENFAYTYTDLETGDLAIDPETGELLLNLVPPTSNQISLARASLRDARLTYQEAQAYVSLLKGESIPEEANNIINGNSIAKLEQAKLALEAANLAIENTSLRSPISGTITNVSAREGQPSGTNSIIEIKSIDQMVLSFYLEENALPYIRPDTRLVAHLDAYQDLEIAGKIINIDPSLTTKDGELVIHGWASLEIPQGIQLLSLMSAEVEVIAAETYDALIVPVQAVRELAPGSYSVFVVKEDQQLEMRVVSLGIKDFANAEILSGLSKGEIVSTGTIETVQ